MKLRKGYCLLAVATAILVLLATGCSAQQETNLPDGLYAKMETSKGTIMLELEYKKVPLTVMNFVGLAEGVLGTTRGDGTRFYDGLTFHRVVKDPEPFVIQGGDPNGDGTGGPGYTFPDEFDASLTHDAPGVLSMANSGPDTNGSQFFITLNPEHHLDGRHAVFGRVVSGMDVVNKIAQGDKIKKVTIIRVGDDAKAFTVTKAAFEQRIAAIEDKRSADLKAVRDAALAEIEKKWPGATKTDTGIRYIIEKQGSGPLPTRGNTVSMNFTVQLVDGTQIGSSEQSGPLQFPVGTGRLTLPGWDAMALEMKKGEKRLVILPPDQAFGDAGVPGQVPAGTFIVLDLEMLSVDTTKD